jgi:predicted amidohydrolase
MKIQRKTLARRNAVAGQDLLRVAAVQFRSVPDPMKNLSRILAALATCAKKGVQVAAFPECALTSYVPAAILGTTPKAIAGAEAELVRACGELKIAALVGTAHPAGGKWQNTALVADATGRRKARYTKQYLVGGDRSWGCAPGEQAPPVFSLGGAKASVIICHDNRYPELCRLPVLAGAQIIFYLSHECNLTKRSKLGPCRAQVQARAVENNVFIVHANAPSDGGDRGSHGESRIVGPDGNILLEASQREEEILIADLDVRLATRAFALNSLRGPHRQWWREGLRKVRVLR